MDLKTYRAKQAVQKQIASLSTHRALCRKCRKASLTCYCKHIEPFTSKPQFVILIHPKENRKRVGTGRMTHLCISNSVLIEGVNFTNNDTVNQIIQNPGNWPVVLYPGKDALDITKNARSKLEAFVPPNKKLVVIVIDGSWPCAKKMLKMSSNLQKLPQICFVPPHRSIYQIRRQPRDICFSTVEAVHLIIDQLGGKSQEHENLLAVFRVMIAQQLDHVARPGQRATRGARSSNKARK